MKLAIAGLPEEDLRCVVNEIEKIRDIYTNREILIYGGTGFIGTWLTASLLFAIQELKLNSRIKIVTRNAGAANLKFKNNLSDLQIYQHDLSHSAPDNNIEADLIFHAGTPSRKSTGSENSQELTSATLNAAMHAVSVTSKNLPRPHVIHLNSGAIYGTQISPLREETDEILKSNLNPYIRAKIQADEILFKAKNEGLIDLHSPRLFAFGGPLLPLNEHFAIGNFVSDGLQNKKIEVKGNPQTTRSYMYPSDLVSILLKLPSQKTDLPLNIGSESIINMKELATLISELTSNKGIYFTNPNAVVSHYVPSVRNLKNIFGSMELTSTEALLMKWITWINFISK